MFKEKEQLTDANAEALQYEEQSKILQGCMSCTWGKSVVDTTSNYQTDHTYMALKMQSVLLLTNTDINTVCVKRTFVGTD